MGSPDTNPQSEEFARENQFRVEIPNAERLYDALSHAYEIEPRTFMSAFKIGTSHSEDELFSQINVHAMVADIEMNFPVEGHSIYASLTYQNPDHQYWQKEQVQQLQELLTDKYDSITHRTENDHHSLIIKDSNAGLMYVLSLGAENERAEWKNQVEGANEMLKQTNHPLYPLLKLATEQALAHLKSSPHPFPSDSLINIKPIGADPNSIGRQDLFPPTEEFRTFTKTVEKWSKFIEDAVNAMAKVKGIPQSGKLTLLPPQDVPQT